MSQEGHMKDLECILGDSRILAEQLLWSVIPRCAAPRSRAMPVVKFPVVEWLIAHCWQVVDISCVYVYTGDHL